ncbi:sporulation protein [Bacillus suaedaesalsae]|uniref:Sporulation protein n=1 Tax=Bacillus suaedaesalsae TaxID=2810349 RepID=A0ABS2DPB7_9BACI|nr:sporulation protein [Bacillus suaedaesalsae]MBM6619496.1 sporulation protein [Bacillus suaedaesalsae]
MSLFNKVLASIGIGGAKVDTKLHKGTYSAGEAVQGVVEITGGNTEQPIDEIYLSVMTTYIKEVDDNKFTQTGTVGKFRVLDKLTIGPNEKKEIPFSFDLPYDTPLTAGRTRVWIHTGLDIKNAVDPTDKDFITVTPSPLAHTVLQSVQELGFRIREAECIAAPRYLRGTLPFIQEFEFVPTSGSFRGKLDELEVTFLSASETRIDVLLQVDRRARGLGSLLSEALNMDESHIRLSFSASEMSTIKHKLQEVINRYS